MTNDQMKEIIAGAVNDLNTLGNLLADLGVYQLAYNTSPVSDISRIIYEKIGSEFIFEASILAPHMKKLPFFDKEACEIRTYAHDSFRAELEFGGIVFVAILSYDEAIRLFPERVRELKPKENRIIEFQGKRFQLIEEDPAGDLDES